MGSGSSRMGSPRHRGGGGRPRPALASFLCGGGGGSSPDSAAAPPPSQVENDPSDGLVTSPRLHDVLTDNLQSSGKGSSVNVRSENCSSSSIEEHMRSSISSNDSLKDRSPEGINAETSDFGKCFSESRELVPCLANDSSTLDMTYPERTSDLGSTSTKTEHVEALLANVDTLTPPVYVADNPSNNPDFLTSPVRFSSGISQVEVPTIVTSSNEGFPNENLGIHSTNSTSAVSSTSESWHLLREESPFDGNPPGSAFVSSSASGDRNNRTILHVDMLSLSSNILPTDIGNVSSHEARRNSRRLFWDAFSRRSSRRSNEYAAIFLTTEDSDGMGSHGRSLLDIGDGLFEDDSIYLRRRRHGLNGRSWPTRSEIRDRFHGAFDGSNGQASFCPTGLHPDGMCSCDSLMMAGESSTRASISRIVLLAEALFEVLDEIHRQPVSLSLSMVSLPAPESVVNSLPLKCYTRLDSVGTTNDGEQCYICLDEYDEGDNIRVLPCHHEYHMLCVDKWLKEIHGVCPLCRGDVCEGVNEGSTTNS